MEKTHERLQELIGSYLEQNVSVDERQELWDYINDPMFEKETKNVLSASFNEVDPIELEKSKQEDILQHIFNQEQTEQKRPIVRSLWPKVAIAASVIIVCGLGFYFHQQNQQQLSLAELATRNGISSGGNKAVLSLANGKEMVLSENQTGIVINASHVSYADGTELAKIEQNTNQPYTITTPKGGTYQVALADGTKVWLNADSKLSFSANRTTELSGEAYFEVAKDPQHPFIVNGTDQNVTVLGTRFNINSDQDKKETRTTLLEGSVNVAKNKGGQAVKLIPSQQSLITLNKISVKTIDTADVVAWKNGYFNFNNEDIRSIMSAISKWYNVDVEYVGEVSNARFNGQISRSKNIGAVLGLIQKTNNIKFEIEGRTVKVIQ